MPELLLGCGNSRKKHLVAPGRPSEWTGLVTLDFDPDCKPDIEWDLNRLSRGEKLPFEENFFDEIGAYHVLEHFGAQGDFRAFFAHFTELWRVMKPDGLLCAIVPRADSQWAWGDPGHTRVIPQAMITFLDQTEYTRQVGVTALADYRRFYRADFAPQGFETQADEFYFCLRAVKPSRITV